MEVERYHDNNFDILENIERLFLLTEIKDLGFTQHKEFLFFHSKCIGKIKTESNMVYIWANIEEELSDLEKRKTVLEVKRDYFLDISEEEIAKSFLKNNTRFFDFLKGKKQARYIEDTKRGIERELSSINIKLSEIEESIIKINKIEGSLMKLKEILSLNRMQLIFVKE